MRSWQSVITSFKKNAWARSNKTVRPSRDATPCTLAQAVMAPLICWSFSSPMDRQIFRAEGISTQKEYSRSFQNGLDRLRAIDRARCGRASGRPSSDRLVERTAAAMGAHLPPQRQGVMENPPSEAPSRRYQYRSCGCSLGVVTAGGTA
jgi:hypothetical protein